MCEQNQAMEGKSSIWFGAIFMMIHINTGWILFLRIAMTIPLTAGIPPAFSTALCQRIHPSGLRAWTSRITSGFSCLLWKTGPRKALCPFNYCISWRKPLTQAVTLGTGIPTKFKKNDYLAFKKMVDVHIISKINLMVKNSSFLG